jgi:dynein heavy chain, axonemal
MRVIRSDKLMNAISDFVVTKLGVYFITPPDFDLGIVFKDSNSSIPLIFVLSPGADPLASL